MPFRFYFFFFLFSFFFLFYPGTHPFYQIAAYNRSELFETKKNPNLQIRPIPYSENLYQPDISALGSYIVELNSFTPVYGKNQSTKFFPASTTKIITALVAVDLYSHDDVITVHNPKEEGQTMGLSEGERITVENLLYGMLVYSGNDAAYAFANDYGYPAFIKKMNEKAKSLGMKNSTFSNPAGLDEYLQKSTPADLAIAARELIKNPYLRKMVGTKEIIISDVDYKTFHTLKNVNKLLGEIQGIGGLKTGYTENAGENLVSFYRMDGHDYIIVVMQSKDRFEDTKNIVTWIGDNVRFQNP